MSGDPYAKYPPEVAALLRSKDEELRSKDEELQRAEQKGQGSFYAKTSQVWGVESATATQDKTHWKKFRRTKKRFKWPCIGMSKMRRTKAVYGETKRHALDKQDAVLVPKERSRSSTSLDTKKSIWQTDIVGNPSIGIAEGAHLLPAGEEIDHFEWFQVGAAAVGIEESENMMTKLKALRGCKPKGGNRRFEFEGILHFVSNRLLMASQKYALDGNKPRMLIIPLLSPEAIRDWTGTGYRAIVLVGNPHCDVPWDNPLSDADVHDTYQKCGFSRNGIADAVEDDLTKARLILREGILALAEMIQSLTEQDLQGVENHSKGGAANLRAARDTLLGARNSAVHVPSALTVDFGQVHVASVQFAAHTDTGGHPAPDPFLLLMKDANIWARMTGMRFLANGNLPNLDSEQDEQAQEMYLEYKESLERNPSREELARRLGQPPTVCSS